MLATILCLVKVSSCNITCAFLYCLNVARIIFVGCKILVLRFSFTFGFGDEVLG